MSNTKPSFIGGSPESPLLHGTALNIEANGDFFVAPPDFSAPLVGGRFVLGNLHSKRLSDFSAVRITQKQAVIRTSGTPFVELDDPLVAASMDVTVQHVSGPKVYRFFFAPAEFLRTPAVKMTGATWEAARNAYVAFGAKGGQIELGIDGTDVVTSISPRLVSMPQRFITGHPWEEIQNPGNPFRVTVPDNLEPDGYLTLTIERDEGPVLRLFSATVRVIEGAPMEAPKIPDAFREQLDRIETKLDTALTGVTTGVTGGE